MKFSIVANTKRENIREKLKKVIGFVDDFELDKVTASFLGLNGVEIKDLSGDVIISLGGDGTILHILSQINKPILGINFGGVGFLNESFISCSDFPFNFMTLHLSDLFADRLSKVSI